jgi:hypothetical protein
MWNFLDTIVTDIKYSYRGATVPDFFRHFLFRRMSRKQKKTQVITEAST